MANEKKTTISDKDFVFVQEKKTIVDVKLQTKPTTFFNDAMKRFVKNKASVIAASLIGFLVSLSVLVPIFNTNNIEAAASHQRFLPPRWAGFEDLGIADGTIVYKNIIGSCYVSATSKTPNGNITASSGVSTPSTASNKSIKISQGVNAPRIMSHKDILTSKSVAISGVCPHKDICRRS